MPVHLPSTFAARFYGTDSFEPALMVGGTAARGHGTANDTLEASPSRTSAATVAAPVNEGLPRIARMPQTVAQNGLAMGQWIIAALASSGGVDVNMAQMPAYAMMGLVENLFESPLAAALAPPTREGHGHWPPALQAIMRHGDYMQLPVTELSIDEREQARCCITLEQLDALDEPVAVRLGQAVQVYDFAALLRFWRGQPARGPQTPDGVPAQALYRVQPEPHGPRD